MHLYRWFFVWVKRFFLGLLVVGAFFFLYILWLSLAITRNCLLCVWEYVYCIVWVYLPWLWSVKKATECAVYHFVRMCVRVSSAFHFDYLFIFRFLFLLFFVSFCLHWRRRRRRFLWIFFGTNENIDIMPVIEILTQYTHRTHMHTNDIYCKHARKPLWACDLSRPYLFVSFEIKIIAYRACLFRKARIKWENEKKRRKRRTAKYAKKCDIHSHCVEIENETICNPFSMF